MSQLAYRRTGRTTAGVVGGTIAIGEAWSLRGATLATGFAWVQAGKFSIPLATLPGADFSSTAALVGGARTTTLPAVAGLGAGASVGGGVFTLSGTPAAGVISSGATITGGTFTPVIRNIAGGTLTAEATINAGLAGDGPNGAGFSSAATMVGGMFLAPVNGAAFSASASVMGGYPPVNFSTVALQIPGDGANNSTNIVDVSNNGLTITRHGAPVISTAASVYGGSSVRFYAATTDALSINDSTLGLSSQDFWFEMRLKFFVQNLASSFILSYNHDNATFGAGGTSNFISLGTLGGQLRFILYAYSSSLQRYHTGADDVTLTLTDFNHYCAGRVGSQLATWVNGKLYQMTLPFTAGNKNIGNNAIRSLGNYIHIGARLREGSPSYYDNGNNAYMDDFRFVKGTPPWGLNDFTPTGPHPTS